MSSEPNSSPDLPQLESFYFFPCLLEITVEEKVHLGFPKQALAQTTAQGVKVRWGSPIELAWPNTTAKRVRWTDDALTGLATRKERTPQGLLGAEGTLGGKKARFELILDLGQNQVVYCLLCDGNRFRTAYGFSLREFPW